VRQTTPVFVLSNNRFPPVSIRKRDPLNLRCFFAWLIFSLVFPHAGNAEAVKVSHYFDQQSLRIVLDWPTSIPAFKAEVEENILTQINLKEIRSQNELAKESFENGTSLQGQNLVLRFSQPIEIPNIEGLVEAIPDWIKKIKTGYDSLLLQATNESAFRIFEVGNKVVIQVSLVSLMKFTTADSEDRELLHLESSLLLQTHKFEAQSRLQELLNAHPQDPKIMADLAEAEGRLGRWREAIKHYDCALPLEPDSIDLVKSKSYLRGQYGPQVRADQYYRDTSNEETQWVSRLMARESFCSDLAVGVFFENRVVNDNQIRPRNNGSLDVFEGNRQRWNTYVEMAQGFSTSRLAVVGQETEPGVSLEHQRHLPVGELYLQGVYHEPYWEFVEGLIGEGTADRLRIKWIYEGHSPFIGKYRGKNYLSGLAGISANRYGVEDDNDVAESIQLEAELRYHIDELLSGLSIGYQFNGEYVDLTDSRIDTDGNNFSPLPIQNLQTQAWDISLSEYITSHLRFDLAAGFKYDNRVDSKGPFVFFDLIYDSFSNIDVGMNVEFNQESARGTDNTFTQIGAFIIWKL